MADRLEVSRSVELVSVDTHPANNSLVITYEIAASVFDAYTRKPLARQNKRDQFQLTLAAIDRLTVSEVSSIDQPSINVDLLVDQVLRRCPLLASTAANGRVSLEDIKLHILYLANRRQTQLLSSGYHQADRPASASSTRSRSGRSSAIAVTATSVAYNKNHRARTGSAASHTRSPAVDATISYEDVYAWWSHWHSSRPSPDRVEEFLQRFDQQLASRPEELTPDTTADKTASARRGHSEICDFDTHLEGLYGDHQERARAMAMLRQPCRSEAGLSQMSENNLLVCAMLRCLRDLRPSSLADYTTGSILYCLARLTWADELRSPDTVTPASTANKRGHDPHERALDLLELTCELLSKFATHLTDHNSITTPDSNTDKKRDQKQSKRPQTTTVVEGPKNSQHLDDNQLFHVSTLLVIQHNIVASLSTGAKGSPLDARCGHCLLDTSRESDGLGALLHLATRRLRRDLSLLLDVWLVSELLGLLLDILVRLSGFRDFVGHIRTQRKTVSQLDVAACSLLLVVQDRCGSTAVGIARTLYGLEMNTLSLLANLILDKRLRARLLKRNLLKCVLNNLVVHLASQRRRAKASLRIYGCSPVLLLPMKCIYELTCDDVVKRELYKSKVITRCLLDYLLATSCELKEALDRQEAPETTTERSSSMSSRKSHTNAPLLDTDIVCDGTRVHQYILALWLNLSSRPEASVHSPDSELSKLLYEYLVSSLQNLNVFINASEAHQRALMVDMYMHVKLVRNLTQLATWQIAAQSEWLESIASDTCKLMCRFDIHSNPLVALVVDSIAIMGHLSQATVQNLVPQSAGKLWQVFELLLDSLNTPTSDTDNDDLLLVAMNFIATLAQTREICSNLTKDNSGETTINQYVARCLYGANLVLGSRATDHELVISTQHALGWLLNHSRFATCLAQAFELGGAIHTSDIDSSDTPILAEMLSRLAELTLSPSASVARLCIVILERIKALEMHLDRAQEECSVVTKQRFEAYNAKWLAALRASRQDLSSTRADWRPDRVRTSSGLASSTSSHDFDEVEMSALADASRRIHDDDDELEQSRRVSEIDGRVDIQRRNHRRHVVAADNTDDYGEDDEDHRQELAHNSIAELDEAANFDDYEDDYDDDLTGHDSETGPDLNVIDDISMIQHLNTTRRSGRA